MKLIVLFKIEIEVMFWLFIRLLAFVKIKIKEVLIFIHLELCLDLWELH